MIRIKNMSDLSEHPFRIRVYDDINYAAQSIWISETEAIELYNQLVTISAEIIQRRADEKK